jgi:hypothetical protein
MTEPLAILSSWEISHVKILDLFISKREKVVMEKLLVLFGTFAGGKVVEGFNATTLLKVIQGLEEPSEAVSKAAQMLSSMLSTVDRRDLVTNSVSAILHSENLSSDDAVSLVGKAAPFVGVKPPQSLAETVDLVGALATRIADKPRAYTTQALITCPGCNLVHSVGS